MSNCHELVEKAVINNLNKQNREMPLDHVLLYGPPGTGKTYWAYEMGKRLGRPVYSTGAVSKTMEIEGSALSPLGTIQLRLVSTVNGKVLDNPQSTLQYHPGPLARAMGLGGKPGICLFNEADAGATSDLPTLLYIAGDDPEMAEMHLPNGDVIKPQPEFMMVATSNERPADWGYPPAVLDRFAVQVRVDQPSHSALAKLPREWRDYVKAQYKLDDDKRNLSYRDALQIWTMMQAGTSRTDAVRLVKGRAAVAIENDLAALSV